MILLSCLIGATLGALLCETKPVNALFAHIKRAIVRAALNTEEELQ